MTLYEDLADHTARQIAEGVLRPVCLPRCRVIVELEVKTSFIKVTGTQQRPSRKLRERVCCVGRIKGCPDLRWWADAYDFGCTFSSGGHVSQGRRLQK